MCIIINILYYIPSVPVSPPQLEKPRWVQKWACGTAIHIQMVQWRRRTATRCAFAAISSHLMGKNYRCLGLVVVNASLSLKRHIFLCPWKSLSSCHSKPFIIWNITKETADTLLRHSAFNKAVSQVWISLLQVNDSLVYFVLSEH